MDRQRHEIWHAQYCLYCISHSGPTLGEGERKEGGLNGGLISQYIF